MSVTIIDSDKFEISQPVQLSVADLKNKVADCDQRIANAEKFKQEYINECDEKINNATQEKVKWQALLDQAAAAGMVVAEAVVE